MNIKDLKTFEDRYNYDVKALGLSKKKGDFDYLSWAYAQKLAKIFDEKSSWRIIKNDDGSFIHNGFLLLEMTFLGQTEQLFYPILDNYHKPIMKPNAYNINTSQMRGFAKLFAMMSGFGLSLYANEDLAYLDQENVEKGTKKQQAQMSKEEEKQRKEEGIKEILILINDLTNEQANQITDVDFANLEEYSLQELRKIYGKIKNIKNKTEGE